MPTARVTIEKSGLTKVVAVLYRLASGSGANAIFDWEDEVFVTYRSGAEELSKHQSSNYVDSSRTTSSFFAPDAPLTNGTYLLAVAGLSGTTPAARAVTWFQIETGTTGGTGGGSGGTGGSGGNPPPPSPARDTLAGTWSGFVAREGSTSSWGQIDLKVNRRGTFSGTAAFLSTSTRMKGELVDGQMFMQALGESRTLLLRPNAAWGVIEAEIIGGNSDDKWVGTLRAAQYDARRNPCPVAGSSTMTDTETQEIRGTEHPAGSSRAVVRVSKAGRFTCVGKLAHVTAFSTGGLVHPGTDGGNSFTFSTQNRRTKDTVRAYEGTISRGGGPAGIAAQMWVDWTRDANAGARQYADGFFIVQHLEAPGAR
jgi:hypothetical protein